MQGRPKILNYSLTVVAFPFLSHVHVSNFIICLCFRLLVRSGFSCMTQMNQKTCIHMRVHSLVIQPKLTPKNLITKHSRTTRILSRGSVTWNREKCCIFLPSGGIMFGHSVQVSLLVSGGHDHDIYRAVCTNILKLSLLVYSSCELQ